MRGDKCVYDQWAQNMRGDESKAMGGDRCVYGQWAHMRHVAPIVSHRLQN
jgi:hypothetical protein